MEPITEGDTREVSTAELEGQLRTSIGIYKGILAVYARRDAAAREQNNDPL